MDDEQLKDLIATTTPADTDILYTVVDPAGTPLDRKITWTSIKAFLKTYFDTLYPLDFTPEDVANKRTSFQATPTNTAYPSEKLVKDSLDGKANLSGATFTGAIVTADHGTATNPEVVAVVYGTGTPPTANTTPIGTLFVKYTA